MVENYDQIICPHCQQKYQTNKARFFWIITPKNMALIILIVPMVYIALKVLQWIKEVGVLF